MQVQKHAAVTVTSVLSPPEIFVMHRDLKEYYSQHGFMQQSTISEWLNSVIYPNCQICSEDNVPDCRTKVCIPL